MKVVERILGVLMAIGVLAISCLACWVLSWLATMLFSVVLLILGIALEGGAFNFVRVIVAVGMLLAFWIPLLTVDIKKKK